MNRLNIGTSLCVDFKLEFIELISASVTFLCPHKKVTKEGGIGVGFAQIHSCRVIATGNHNDEIRCATHRPSYVPPLLNRKIRLIFTKLANVPIRGLPNYSKILTAPQKSEHFCGAQDLS